MDDGVPLLVEFLDDDLGGSGDGIVPGPPGRAPKRLHLVVGTLIVALAAVCWARSTNDPSPAGAGAALATAASPQPVRKIEDPSAMVNSAYALVGPCPAGAQCFVSGPAAAAAALQAAFPGAVPTAAASILANRAGHTDPGLLRRVILAERGDQAIQVRIQAGAIPGSEYVRRPSSPRGIARVTVQWDGYAISVVVIGPGATQATARATRLAEDRRLLATG